MGIRHFWDYNGKREVGSVPVGPSTTADPKLMVDLVLLSNDDSSHNQSNQDHDEMYSSNSDSDSEDLSQVKKKTKPGYGGTTIKDQDCQKSSRSASK